MTYNVLIEEVVSQYFEIDAETPEAALEKAKEQYGDGTLVVDQGSLESAKAVVIADPETGASIEEEIF